MTSSLLNISVGIHRIECKYRNDDQNVKTCGIKYQHCNSFVATFFFYNIIDYNLTKQKTNKNYFYKEITKKKIRKYSTTAYLTAFSSRTVKKVGRICH